MLFISVYRTYHVYLCCYMCKKKRLSNRTYTHTYKYIPVNKSRRPIVISRRKSSGSFHQAESIHRTDTCVNILSVHKLQRNFSQVRKYIKLCWAGDKIVISFRLVMCSDYQMFSHLQKVFFKFDGGKSGEFRNENIDVSSK